MKNIKVLGSDGCANCTNLKKQIETFISENQIDATVEKVTDIVEIMKYGIMSTPGVVIDEEVKCSGRNPTIQEIDQWLK